MVVFKKEVVLGITTSKEVLRKLGLPPRSVLDPRCSPRPTTLFVNLESTGSMLFGQARRIEEEDLFIYLASGRYKVSILCSE